MKRLRGSIGAAAAAACLAVLALIAAVIGGGGPASSGKSALSGGHAAPSASGELADSSATGAGSSGSKRITLTFFTNNADRSTGQGKVEQLLIDAYMKLHPDINIRVETLSPDSQYQDKIQVLNATNRLPDIFSSWGSPSFLAPLINNHALAVIPQQDIQPLGIFTSALEGFESGGQIYGLPRNTDFWVMYYNKKLFADHGLKVPKTDDELLADVAKLKAANLVPIAMDGMDAWISGIWFETMLQRESGTWDTSRHAADRSGSFKNGYTLKAAQEMQQWIRAGAFGSGFLNQDYGTARDLFGQGKAAMYMMGEWEMGMAHDANLPLSVRQQMGAFPIPAVAGGEGTRYDLASWFGGGYSVSNHSKHKEAAIRFLEWMFRPEEWTKAVWVNGVTFPAQNYEPFITGQESGVQKDLTAIFDGSISYSGTLTQDRLSTDAQKIYYDSIQKLEDMKMTPEAFASAIDEAAADSAQASQASR